MAQQVAISWIGFVTNFALKVALFQVHLRDMLLHRTLEKNRKLTMSETSFSNRHEKLVLLAEPRTRREIKKNYLTH